MRERRKWRRNKVAMTTCRNEPADGGRGATALPGDMTSWTMTTRPNSSPTSSYKSATPTHLPGLVGTASRRRPKPPRAFGTSLTTARTVRSFGNESNNRTILAMTYDRMGRRVTKSASVSSTTATCKSPTIKQFFVWDCSEPVATRQFAWHVHSPAEAEDNSSSLIPNSSFYYIHDGNKNVSDVIDALFFNIDGPEKKLKCFDYEELGQYGLPGREARFGCGICPCKKK